MKKFSSVVENQSSRIRRGFRSLLLIMTLIITGSSAFATNYYWVGGTGSWSMLSHWATTSGGSTMHTQLPGQYDDVFFDNHSFPSGGVVTIGAASYCNNIDFTGITGNPTLAGSGTLKVYGSMMLATGLNITYAGMIYFESTLPGNTINTRGRQLQSNVYFNGAGGGWTLADSLSLGTGKSVFLYNGSLTTNNKNISCARFASDRTFARDLSLGSSVLRLYDNTVNALVLYLQNLTFNAGTSEIRFLGGNGAVGGGISINDQNQSLPVTFNKILFGYSSGASTLNSAGKSICTFNQVIFSGDGYINGSNTFTNLTFTAGKSYTLQSKKKQTILGSLTATGGCNGYISLQSSISGQADTIYKAAGTVNATKCIMRDICKAGAATFAAASSMDMGNNTGWTFTLPTSTTYYWVGGSGNWDSPLHWSLTSGGSGGSCIPGPNDNVIFNSSSFNGAGQSVTINGTQATCKNMTWTAVNNMPDFSGTSAVSLLIFGSMNLNANFSMSYTGNIKFMSSSTGNTIHCGGKALNGDIYFRGTGAWTLSDSLCLTTGKSLYFYSGNLNTNNKKIRCYRFVSDLTEVRNLTLGNSEIIIQSPLATTAMSLSMTNLTLDGGTSTLRFTGVSGVNAGGFTISGTSNSLTHLYDVVMSSPGASASLYVLTTGGAQFRNVSFLGSGNIYGNNTYNNLAFAAGSSYFLQAGKVQTINGSWTATGNCNGYIMVQSTLYASPATVVGNGSNIALDHILIRDVQVSGVSFAATNAMNLGGNSGWSFTAPASQTYYWINGSGIWSSQSKWSLTSGGSPAGCIPGPNDNVVFDNNSFPTTGAIVTIDPIPAYCRNMTWSNPANNPQIAGTTATNIRIFGSLNLHNSMTYNYKGKLYFESADTANLIRTAGKVISSDIYLQGTGGWKLSDSLVCGNTNTLFFYNGTFNTNNQKIKTLRFTSDKTTSRNLKLGSSKITVAGVGSAPAFYLNTLNLTINAGTSHIILPNFSGNYAGTIYLTNTAVNSTVQLYDVDFTASSGMASLSTNSNLTAMFHKVTMSGNNKIQGNNVFDTLQFTPGMIFNMQSNKTQTINSFWGVSGQCTVPVTLEASIAGTQAKVSMASGTVNGYNLVIRDIKTMGGATFNAVNSLDNGNNSGWTFTTQGSLSSPGVISGPATVCNGQTATFSVNPLAGAITYIWTVPAGVIIISGQGTNSITVNIGTLSGTAITVSATDGCSFSPVSSRNISSFSVSFTGIAPVCQNGAVVVLNTGSPAGGSYFGQGVNGSLFSPSIAGPGNHTIGYTYSSGTCIDTAFQVVNVMGAPVMPSQPAGLTVVCQSGAANYTTTVTGGASVIWTLSPAGAGTVTGNGTSSTVNWDPSFSGVAVVSASASNNCGTSAAASLLITVGQGPAMPAPVSGPVSVCQGTPISVFGTSSTGNTGFIWAITPSQAGSINGTDSVISVSWNPLFSGSVTLSARAYNNCDTTAASSYTVHIDTLTAQIIFHNGNTIVCQGSDSVIYSANSYNASGYFWTISPSNAGVLTESGTHAMVNWDSAFTGMATIGVYAYNGCDTIGPVNMAVSVIPGPPQPVVTVAGYILTCSTSPSYQWYFNGTMLQGETNQYCTATATGYYYVIVSNSYGCNDTSGTVYIDVVTGISDAGTWQFNAEVSPNPMTEGGNIVLYLEKNEKVTVDLVDVTGRLLVDLQRATETPSGKTVITVPASVTEQFSGVCFFRISTEYQTLTLPVVLVR